MGFENDKVELTRLWLGDRVKPYIFSDTVVETVLAINPSPVRAAMALACARAAELSDKVDKTIGKTSVKLSQQKKHWLELAEKLSTAGAGDMPNQSNGVGGIRVGGILRSEKDELATDTVHEPFSFTVGQDDIRGSLSAGEIDDDLL